MSARLWVNQMTAQSGVVVSGVSLTLDPQKYPQNESVERLVVGHLLAEGHAENANLVLKKIAPYLHHTDFFYTKYSVIYEAMARLEARGDAIDVESVTRELAAKQGNKMTALEYVGGKQVLYKMANVAPMNTETHAAHIVRLSLRRAVILSGELLRRIGQRDDIELDDMAAMIQGAYQDVNSRVTSISTQDTHDAKEAMPRYLERIRAEVLDDNYEHGIKIWIPELQGYFKGWLPYKLYIFAGGTGMGKSALLLSAAFEALRQRKRVQFFTLEMSETEVMERLLAMASGVDGQRIQTRQLDGDDLDNLAAGIAEVMSWLEEGGLVIEAMNTPTMSQIEARIISRQEETDMVCIDYIGTEMIAYENPNSDPFAENKRPDRAPGSTEHGNQLWMDMRRIKQSYPVPFLVATQINRNYMDRASKRPQRTDIANSSKAENAANAVIFVHRESVVASGDEIAYPSHGDLTIAKNRSGPGEGKMIDLSFNSSTTKFDPWDGQPIVGDV